MFVCLKLSLLLAAVALMLGALAACSPLQALNAITPGKSYRKIADLAYGSDPRQKLDVYTPLNLKAPAPVVVFFYGGNWNSGARNEYLFVGQALASRGMVAVLADYRLYPQVRYPGFIEDSAQAVAWTLREVWRYGGDPGRVLAGRLRYGTGGVTRLDRFGRAL
jgi:acetyl esterase/lipase